MSDYYRVLNLTADAEEEEIKKALNREMRLWSNRTNAPQIERRQEAERMVKLLEEAERVLLNSQKRSQYNGDGSEEEGSAGEAPNQTERKLPSSRPAGSDGDGSRLIEEGWRLLIDDRVGEALEIATRATEKAPTNADGWALLGQARFRLGDIEDAIYEYKRAIKLRPGEASYYSDLGSIYESGERWDDAIGQYQRAAQIEPKTVMYRAAIGIVFIKAGRVDESIEILERCVNEEPENKTYKLALGYAYVDGLLSGWWQQGDQYVCISEEQALRAGSMLEKARALRIDDVELRGKLEERSKMVDRLFTREFKGSWAMVVVLGLFWVVPGVLWWWVNRRQVYKINRDIHDVVEQNKADVVVGGELGAYFSALPPGFKWMAYKCPRYVVWVAILILSPFTFLYLVYDNYGPKYLAGFAGAFVLLMVIGGIMGSFSSPSQRTSNNSSYTQSASFAPTSSVTDPYSSPQNRLPVANTTLSYGSHTSDIEIYFEKDDGASGKCITHVKSFRNGQSDTRTQSYSVKSLGGSKWQITIDDPNPSYKRDIVFWLSRTNALAADDQAVIEALGMIYYNGQELWHGGERSMQLTFKQGNHLLKSSESLDPGNNVSAQKTTVVASPEPSLVGTGHQVFSPQQLVGRWENKKTINMAWHPDTHSMETVRPWEELGADGAYANSFHAKGQWRVDGDKVIVTSSIGWPASQFKILSLTVNELVWLPIFPNGEALGPDQHFSRNAKPYAE